METMHRSYSTASKTNRKHPRTARERVKQIKKASIGETEPRNAPNAAYGEPKTKTKNNNGDAMKTECIWTDNGEGTWLTSCENDFVLTTGTPSENSMRFCCYCGLPLKEIHYEQINDMGEEE